jgi:hypothetical protein
MATGKGLRRNAEPDAEHDPVLRALLTAPIDDEPLTEAEEEALAEADAETEVGQGLSTAELRQRLGLLRAR